MSAAPKIDKDCSAAASARSIVVGTAGHIDHGKTALVKALTGVDADRLKEEKERGITIELGFANFTLPGGENVALIDVPGHERFVKNMAAGASGIDYVILVVAADEGVMPQTREHLDICSLLEINAGLVVLTKADLVDEDLLELAREDVFDLLKGTFLEGAPILAVSSTTGQGVEDLKAAIDRMAKEHPPARGSGGLFRLPVDRAFTMRGFGAVVAGTIASGAIAADDDVEVLPRKLKAKVRGIQVHGEKKGSAFAGQRAALNLGGVDLRELKRGDVVAASGMLRPTYMMDARIELSRHHTEPLPNLARLRLHLGTQEAPAVAALLDRDELLPGEGAYAQLRTLREVVCSPGDRFVLRSFSPATTVAGGVVLDSRPKKHKRGQAEALAALDVLHKGSLQDKLGAFLKSRKFSGMSLAEVHADLGVSKDEAGALLKKAEEEGIALLTDSRTSLFHHSQTVDGLKASAAKILKKHHEQKPLQQGMETEELRSRFPGYIDRKLVDFALTRMISLGEAEAEGKTLRLAGFAPRLDNAEEELREKVSQTLSRRKYAAPTLPEISAELGENEKVLAPLLEFMVAAGDVVKTKEGLFFESAAISELSEKVIALLRERGEIGVSDIKNITGATRKYSIPLIECLDGRKITLRKGDMRIAGPSANL